MADVPDQPGFCFWPLHKCIPNGNVLQRRIATTKGARSETLLSFGGNYNNKLFLGMDIGIPTLRYLSNSIYEETDALDTIYDFRSFTLNENLETRGIGINFKF